MERAAVDEIAGGGLTAPPWRDAGSEIDDERGAALQRAPALGQQRERARGAGRRSTTPLSTSPPAVPSGRDATYSDASAMLTE